MYIYIYLWSYLCKRILHDTMANDPRSDVPVRSASTLILRFDHPFLNNEIPMPKGTRKKTPDTSYQIIHVKCHNICAGEDTLQIWFQKIRSWKSPLSRSNGEKKIRKSTQTYLASQSATVLIQIWMTLGIEASHQHNAHQICQRILHNIPIPTLSL